MTPFAGGARGLARDRLHHPVDLLSLVAVFIPLLLMGGIVGRLFREFAVTVTMTIAVSALVSLTLTPMMGARLLQADERQRAWARLSRHRALLRQAAARLQGGL